MATQGSSGGSEGKWIRRHRTTYVRRAMPPIGLTGLHLVYFPGGLLSGGICILATLFTALTLLTLPAYFFGSEAKPPSPGIRTFLFTVATLPVLVGLHGLVRGLSWMFKSDADWEKAMRARDQRDTNKA